MKIASTSAVTEIPPLLSEWIQERGFHACPWLPAPTGVHKIIGRDAWRLGKFILSRVPLETDALRYYVAICLTKVSGQAQGRAVGYWLEVRQVPGSLTEMER